MILTHQEMDALLAAVRVAIHEGCDMPGLDTAADKIELLKFLTPPK